MVNEEWEQEKIIEHNKFITTEKGKEWVEHLKGLNNGQVGDFADYLYDFYPEYLC